MSFLRPGVGKSNVQMGSPDSADPNSELVTRNFFVPTSDFPAVSGVRVSIFVVAATTSRKELLSPLPYLPGQKHSE